VSNVRVASIDELMRIGELSRRTGVSAHVLRSWEKRYGLLEPERTEGGFRLYSDADERRIRAMIQRIDEGFSPAAAARQLIANGRHSPSGHAQDDLSEDVQALRRALEGLDEDAAAKELDRIFRTFSVATAIDEVLIPYLLDLGDRWERQESTVSEEHFATFILRGRLLSLARGWGAGNGPIALLSCAPGEDHDLGLICFGLGLREQGWRIVMLGANTPTETVATSAEAMSPDLVVITSTSRERLTGERDRLRSIAARHRLLLGGAGADPQIARDVGAEVPAGPPMRAAATLAHTRN